MPQVQYNLRNFHINKISTILILKVFKPQEIASDLWEVKLRGLGAYFLPYISVQLLTFLKLVYMSSYFKELVKIVKQQI